MKKLSKEEIVEAKDNIMNGKSITSEATRLQLDRATLKKYITEILSTEEAKSFEIKLTSNLRTNRVSIRKQKQMDAKNKYEEIIGKLVQKGIDEKDIATIYEITSHNKHSKMAKDTFVLKLLDLLEFSEERNNGISINSTGYISKNNVIEMIEKDPKLMTNDINKKIKPICKILDQNPELTTEEVNEIIKKNPHIFRNSIKKISMLSIIGENFLVREGVEYIELFKYMLTIKPHMLAINPEKLYKRLSAMKDISKSTIIEKQDLDDLSRNVIKNTNTEIDDSRLTEKYQLPEYNEQNPEKFRVEIKKSLSVKRNEVKEQ